MIYLLLFLLWLMFVMVALCCARPPPRSLSKPVIAPKPRPHQTGWCMERTGH